MTVFRDAALRHHRGVTDSETCRQHQIGEHNKAFLIGSGVRLARIQDLFDLFLGERNYVRITSFGGFERRCGGVLEPMISPHTT